MSHDLVTVAFEWLACQFHCGMRCKIMPPKFREAFWRWSGLFVHFLCFQSSSLIEIWGGLLLKTMLSETVQYVEPIKQKNVLIQMIKQYYKTGAQCSDITYNSNKTELQNKRTMLLKSTVHTMKVALSFIDLNYINYNFIQFIQRPCWYIKAFTNHVYMDHKTVFRCP